MTTNDVTISFTSARFGDISVPESSVITLPHGMIGFPDRRRFVLLDYKVPFSWLHSVEDPNLAFVVMDGGELGPSYDVKPPYGDKECDFQEGDEYAILVVVTIRPDPTMTTANLKAPVFVNLKNRRGLQAIFDDPRLSTRQEILPPVSEEPKEEEKK